MYDEYRSFYFTRTFNRTIETKQPEFKNLNTFIMRPQLSFMLIALCFLVACSDQKQETSATASVAATSDDMDRTSLPIKEPLRQTYKELDAANAKAPTERFDVKAPKGAPNVVVVLIDDIGFGASEAFGGLIIEQEIK